MAKEFRIKLKQRWKYAAGSNTIIAEVTTHPSPTCAYANMRVKQVIAGEGFYKGQMLWGIVPLNNSQWIYLEGQDRP